MSTLIEFKEKVLSSERTFLLNDDHGKTLCTKVPIGQAEYIYTMREYLDGKGIVTDIYEKMKMTAIVKAEKIYMVNPYNVMGSYKEEYPADVFYLNDSYLEEVNLQIKKKVFNKLYDELETVALKESEEMDCQNNARTILVYKKNIDEYIANRQMANIEKISRQKFADSLCGIIDLEEEARKKFGSQKEMWMKLKSSMERIKELVTKEQEKILKQYERDIIDGLHSVEAATVQVTFKYDGKRQLEKWNLLLF